MAHDSTNPYTNNHYLKTTNMEDVFKAMGDALNPNCQPEADVKPVMDRQVAFFALLKAIDEIPDMQIRMNLRDRMIDYINSKY